MGAVTATSQRTEFDEIGRRCVEVRRLKRRFWELKRDPTMTPAALGRHRLLLKQARGRLDNLANKHR